MDNDDLSIPKIVQKYQMHFTRRFGPKHAYGVVDVNVCLLDKDHADNYELKVTARTKPIWKPVKGKTTRFTVRDGEFETWRKNVKLLDFISAKDE